MAPGSGSLRAGIYQLLNVDVNPTTTIPHARFEDLGPERQSYLKHKAATAGTPIPSVIQETRVGEEDMADIDDGPSRWRALGCRGEPELELKILKASFRFDMPKVSQRFVSLVYLNLTQVPSHTVA